MIGSLALATFMVGLTVVVHFIGLLALIRWLRARGHRYRAHESAVGQATVIVLIVLGLVVLHTVEIWLYAVLYRMVGALPDFETALYFSTTSFTTLGYGDIVLEKGWRLVGAIEGANGWLLFGWSTAFLLSVVSRMDALGEHDRERPGETR